MADQAALDVQAALDAAELAMQAANDAAELAMFRAATAAAILQQPQPPTVVVPPTPNHGGVEANIAWTGGSTAEPRPSPLTPDCYRPSDFKNQRSVFTRCTEGLPASKHLEVGSGASSALGGGTHLVTWLNEIYRFLTDTGQESVFLVKDKDGVERSLLTHSGMFTVQDAKAHAADLHTTSDDYDRKNMETSGTALMKSIGPNLHSDLQKFIVGTLLGPVVFMQIVSRIQSSSSSVWRAMVDSLKALRLRQEPGENVDSFSDKITEYCRSLEGANKLPDDVTVILTEAYMDCTVESFKYQFVSLFNQCDRDPESTDWRAIVEEATSSFRRLNGRKAWNVDLPRGGAVGMAGGLVPGNGGARLCFNCGSPDHIQRDCTASPPGNNGGGGGNGGGRGNGNGRVNGPIVPAWKSTPPAGGASEYMTKFDKPYFWCSTCQRWNLTHVSAAHTPNLSRHNGRGNQAPAAGPAPVAPASGPAPAPAPPEAAAMVAPMVSDFSLVQFGGYVCTPVRDDAWYAASEDDENSIPLKD